MTEVLQEREPTRRAPVAVGVAALVVAAVAVFRVVTGGTGDPAGPAPRPAAPGEAAFSASGEYDTAVDHGEYAYVTSLRSVADTAVRVLRVVPLAADGSELPAVVGTPLPQGEPASALAVRTQAAAPDGLVVPPYRSFLALVRVRPDCSSGHTLAGLRVVVRLKEGQEVSHDVTPPGLDDGALRDAACAGPPPPGTDFLAGPGGGGSAYVSDGMRAYETNFTSVWPALVTIVEVVPVDAAGRPVPVELATAVLAEGVGEAKYDLRLRPEPLALRPDQRALLLVRMRMTCDPPRTVAAYRVVAEVEGERVTQAMPVDAGYVPRCGPGRP